MPLTDSLRDDMLASVPSLRAFAISLSGNGDRADDLVQETLLRALANIDSFQPGSNLPAWLFTILRNLFRSDYRKRRREVEDADGSYAKTLKTQPAQNAHLEFEEFRAALDKLPQDQREASLGLGATRWETTYKVVGSYARTGILGSVFLSMARALGETMAVPMVIGNVAKVSSSLLSPGYSIAAVIANEFADATSSLHLSSLIELGLVLFLLTFLLNGLARLMIIATSRRGAGVGNA